MIVNMRGVWGVLSRVSAAALLFGGTVHAVETIRCHDSFFTVVVDSSMDSRATAYVNLIRTTKSRLRGHEKDGKVLRELNELWINQSKTGKIAQIYPGYYGESLIEGPKSDIFRTCSDLAIRLTEFSCAKAEAGDPDALLDAIRAIETINIVRFGSYETLFTTSSYLRKPTKLLKLHLDKLPKDLLTRLQKAQDPDERKLKTLQIEQLSKRQRSQYVFRYGAQMAKDDDITYDAFTGKKGRGIAAERFFGFDREIGFASVTKGK